MCPRAAAGFRALPWFQELSQDQQASWLPWLVGRASLGKSAETCRQEMHAAIAFIQSTDRLWVNQSPATASSNSYASNLFSNFYIAR